MRPLTILCALATLSTTLAVPFSHASNSTSASKSTPSSTVPASLPSPTLSGPNSCPPNKFKQCCTTLSQVGDDLLKPLGMVVPLVGAVELSSLVGVSCRNMPDAAPETDCANAVMCCDSSAVGGDLMQTSCQDFALAKKREREAIERQQRRFSEYQRMMMSQSATPTPTPVGVGLMGSSFSRASATPTRIQGGLL
ncbi:uncharacterized protein NFIA_038830 [Aspergillus fischeri NRRL 181]|uniref:Hydrophobin n=1 Tax=Neosartorya fischeri (strain ATCC 1020 / DSM 3700 / CBS 544.65 / FGSC A1164 / JCM 1740 / NRRL 181 / WB 181) TaxID=331117 RepID=A1CZY9_NEOFI|nr:conserved hypothetical protein [Aspergillus fischeri NRRL 181]EAW24309.1 conserved hypothetical protein [Aspergillus fischeri NRRL 181]